MGVSLVGVPLAGVPLAGVSVMRVAVGQVGHARYRLVGVLQQVEDDVGHVLAR